MFHVLIVGSVLTIFILLALSVFASEALMDANDVKNIAAVVADIAPSVSDSVSNPSNKAVDIAHILETLLIALLPHL